MLSLKSRITKKSRKMLYVYFRNLPLEKYNRKIKSQKMVLINANQN